MVLEIEWCEPPASLEDRVKAALKREPGRWARIKKNMASPTSRSAWRKEGFDAESHPSDTDPKKYDIYARWPATAGATPTPTAQPAPKPAASKPAVVSTPAPVPPADASDLMIPTSGTVAGGYMASRASRSVAANGAKEIRLAGHHPSPVRP